MLEAFASPWLLLLSILQFLSAEEQSSGSQEQGDVTCPCSGSLVPLTLQALSAQDS